MARKPAELANGIEQPAGPSVAEVSGNSGNSVETLDPATLGNSTSGENTGTGEAPKKRRGRQPGSKNKTSVARGKETQTLAVTIADTLTSIHGILYGFTNSELWNIPQEEALKVADRTATVASFYMDLEVPTKIGAWINLGAAVGSVYGLRYIVWRSTRETAKPVEKPKPHPVPQYQATTFGSFAS